MSGVALRNASEARAFPLSSHCCSLGTSRLLHLRTLTGGGKHEMIGVNTGNRHQKIDIIIIKNNYNYRDAHAEKYSVV